MEWFPKSVVKNKKWWRGSVLYKWKVYVLSRPVWCRCVPPGVRQGRVRVRTQDARARGHQVLTLTLTNITSVSIVKQKWVCFFYFKWDSWHPIGCPHPWAEKCIHKRKCRLSQKNYTMVFFTITPKRLSDWINFGLGLRGLDIRPGLDNRHLIIEGHRGLRRWWKVIEGDRRW